MSKCRAKVITLLVFQWWRENGNAQYYDHNAIEETNNKINNTIEQNNNNINNNINKINDRVEYLQAVIASRSRLSCSCQIAVRLQELH